LLCPALAGGYYFPTYEPPDALTRYPNKEGKHYLYEFGLKVGGAPVQVESGCRLNPG